VSAAELDPPTPCAWPRSAAERGFATCYHGRYRINDRGQITGTEVVAHNCRASWLSPLVHFVRHSSGFAWGAAGSDAARSGAADLARALLIDVLGPAALCPACAGRQRVTWASADTDDDPRPYDRKRDGLAELNPLVTPCLCDDGFRSLPYRTLAAEHVAAFADHWRITRGDILAWLVGQYAELPDWLAEACGLTDIELPP
jgi:hypothetical protein